MATSSGIAMTASSIHPIHPGARRDLARALTLLGMAARRLHGAGAPVLVGAAAAEALTGIAGGNEIDLLMASPAALTVALVAQGWQPLREGDLTGFNHTATGFRLRLSPPATAGFLPDAVQRRTEGGHCLLCWPSEALAPTG